MMRRASVIVAALLAAVPGAGPAMQAAPAACPATPASLPPALAAWTKPSPIVSAGAPGELAKATLTIGTAVRATLIPAASVRYPLAPAKPPGAASYGGLFALEIGSTGTYRVALGDAAWIDVVQGGKALGAAAHGHGPECSGIRKTVDFALTPGRYVVQISGDANPAIGIMVIRAQ